MRIDIVLYVCYTPNMSIRPILPLGLEWPHHNQTPVEAPDDLCESDGKDVPDFLQELFARQEELIREFRIRGLIHVYLTKVLSKLRPETAGLSEIHPNHYGSDHMRAKLEQFNLDYDQLVAWAKNLQPLAVVRDEYDVQFVAAFRTYLEDPTLLPSDMSRVADELREHYHQASHNMSWESYWSDWSLKMNCKNRSHENDHRLDFLAVYDEMKDRLGEPPLFEVTINWCLIQDDAGREGLSYFPSVRITNPDKMFKNNRAIQMEFDQRFCQRMAAMPNPSDSDIYMLKQLTKLLRQPSV